MLTYFLSVWLATAESVSSSEGAGVAFARRVCLAGAGAVLTVETEADRVARVRGRG